MKRVISYILVVVIIIAGGSCNRDHLHYQTSNYALIHIEIDWETLSHVTPNGVSTYIFNSDGSKYSDVILSSDPNNVYLKLPPGDYSLVFHNNSISELSGVHLIGADYFDTFSIHANEASYDSVFDALDDEIFVDQPDDVVSYTLHDLHVDDKDIEYHYNKPDLADYQQEVSQTYYIQPDHIVHISRIIAYLDGVEYSSVKKPIAVLHGMSGGYYFGAECTSEEDVMEEFEVNLSSDAADDSESEDSSSDSSSERVNGALDILELDDVEGFSAAELEGLGTAYVDCNTFGMHMTDPEDQHYYLYIRFFLYDGTYTDYEIDVTNYIKTEDTGTNNLYTIEMILTPLPDGGGEPGDGTWGPGSLDSEESSDNTFDPSVDEWSNTEVDLEM